MGYRQSREGSETLYLRSRILLACRQYGLHPLTGLWEDLDDLDGLRSFADYGLQLGFRGQILIHPSHVPVVHEVYTPSDEEVAYHEELVATVEKAVAEGHGAVRFRGTTSTSPTPTRPATGSRTLGRCAARAERVPATAAAHLGQHRWALGRARGRASAPVQRGRASPRRRARPPWRRPTRAPGRRTSCCRSNFSASGQSCDCTSTCLDAASARGALAAISSASSSATSSAEPGSASRLTRCTSAASVAGHIRAGQHQLHRQVVGHAVLEPQKPAGGGGEAPLDLGQAELRVALEATTRSQARHDLEAAGQGVALDGGDQRLARGLLDQAGEAAALDDRALAAGEALEVHARAERAARRR